MSTVRILVYVSLICGLLFAGAMKLWGSRQRELSDIDAARRVDREGTDEPRALMRKLIPLATTKIPPQSGDWLAKHREAGQSFDQYLRIRTTPVRNDFDFLYVLPIGEFSKPQMVILSRTEEFLAAFFGVPVKRLETLPSAHIPQSARRTHPSWNTPQVNSQYLLDSVLLNRRPADAVGVLGLTASDLYPAEGWNFVFGQAAPADRVGVWSMHRNGNAEESEESFRKCLRRTLRTATHETGHMLGILHCTAYECGMNGHNNLEEADRQPIEFCPHCLAKLWWTCKADAGERCQKLIDLAELNGLVEEARTWRTQLESVRESRPRSAPPPATATDAGDRAF